MRFGAASALSRRACLLALAGGAAAALAGAPAAPFCLWPSALQWQALRERAAHEKAVESVLKAVYDSLARGWELPPQALASLDMGLDRQADAPPPYFAGAMLDLERLQALAVLHQLSGQPSYVAKGAEILRAWASVNRPSGRPMDETRLEPAIFAYRLLRPRLEVADQTLVDRWLRAVARALLDSRDLGQPSAWSHLNSHRLKTVGLIGYALGEHELVAGAHSGLQQQLMDDLLPDGRTQGHRPRQAVADQADDLRALLTLSLGLREQGIDLYHWVTPAGASLAGCVAWLLAQLDGQRQAEVRLALPALDLAVAWEPGLRARIEALAPGPPSLRRLLSGGA